MYSLVIVFDVKLVLLIWVNKNNTYNNNTIKYNQIDMLCCLKIIILKKYNGLIIKNILKSGYHQNYAVNAVNQLKNTSLAFVILIALNKFVLLVFTNITKLGILYKWSRYSFVKII